MGDRKSERANERAWVRQKKERSGEGVKKKRRRMRRRRGWGGGAGCGSKEFIHLLPHYLPMLLFLHSLAFSFPSRSFGNEHRPVTKAKVGLNSRFSDNSDLAQKSNPGVHPTL